jgi:hypothetical protein
MAFWDTLGVLVVAFTIGAFFFWLVGYFVYEVVRYALFGPSEQLRSVGTSILDEPPFEEESSRSRAA